MYDENLYEYDGDRREQHVAALHAGAVLYRITSPAHADRTAVLEGKGPERCRDFGRWNGPQQKTSYCANNVLVGIAELLYHQYRQVLRRLERGDSVALINAAAESRRCLVAFRVNHIADLVFVDSDAVKTEFDQRMCGTTVIYPDPHYELMRGLSDRLRRDGKKGVVYPSARHSRDVCFALFDDHTDSILPGPYHTLDLRLLLVNEEQSVASEPLHCNPVKHKLHSTMGYYEFVDSTVFNDALASGMIFPKTLPARAYIDFVRRRYATYPSDAALGL